MKQDPALSLRSLNFEGEVNTAVHTSQNFRVDSPSPSPMIYATAHGSNHSNASIWAYCSRHLDPILLALPIYGITAISPLGANCFSPMDLRSNGSMSLLYCIVSIHLYSASCSAHQSEALPVRETQREESSLERTKRGTWLIS